MKKGESSLKVEGRDNDNFLDWTVPLPRGSPPCARSVSNVVHSQYQYIVLNIM